MGLPKTGFKSYSVRRKESKFPLSIHSVGEESVTRIRSAQYTQETIRGAESLMGLAFIEIVTK